MKKANNNKKLNKNLTVRRNIITISASFALMIVALIATIFVLNYKGYEKKFMAYDGYYNSEQVDDLITDSGKPTQLYQKMSDLYDESSFTRNSTALESSSYISIETKDDFYAFTKLCTTNELKNKKFILLKDIDWKSTTTTRFVTPITSFAGELEGNGYCVKNLTLTPVSSDKLTYNYALFRELASDGKILNFGLVDPVMPINASPESGSNIYLANLCAVNRGEIDHVYVKDSLDEKSTKSYIGMEVINSGFYISGMVAQNYGKFTNSYYAGKGVFKTSSSLSMTPNAIQEVLLENSGTASNLFYYNEGIESYTESGSNISVKYSGVSQVYDYTSTSPRYGTYCKDLNESSATNYGLGEEVTSFSGSKWINANYYENSNFGSFIDFKTPLIKKILDSNVSLSGGIHTVKITTTEDFNYIFNQMLINEKFTDKSMVYELECDINVDDMATMSYNDSIQSKFTVAQSSAENAPVSYHTIYMSKYYNVFTTDTEYKAYGFFPYFAGELSYINFVLGTSSTAVAITDTDTTVKAIGSAIGYAEEAKIDHVNTYLNVSFDNAIGKYLAGGIVGVAAGRTTITNSTANGKITSTDSSRQSFSEAAKNVNGVAIGGCVGYIAKTGASVDTLLSNVEIKSQGYSGKEVTIGGVVAAGYFIDSNKLQNNGSITIAKGSNNTTAVAYSALYAGGVVGRFLGMYSEASFFTNNGDMTLYQAPSSPTYYAGILNSDIQKTNVGSYVLQSKGINQFWAAAMTNGADIKIYSANTGTIMYTYGINLKNSNDFATKLSGIYNINYKFEDETVELGKMEINMNIIKTFAPVVMADNTSNATYAINMSTIYNLRNIEYKTSATVGSATTFDYAGVVYADYVNYTNVRNEGNQTIILNNGISTASNLYVSGVFKSLSNNFKATSIYNGGDILISEPNGSNSQKIIDIYLSGICYQNASVDSDQKQNPLSTTFDKSLVGTLNNTINSGNITVNSYYYNTTTAVNATAPTKPYLNSNIYVGGITNINNGIISNTFNLGDVNIPIYSYAAGKYYEAGGIAYMMDGEYAQIRDSANNGDITVVDTLVKSSKSYVNIGGIVARNTASTNNNKQVISFTINYGTLNAFQAANNTMTTETSSTITTTNAHSSAGGILGVGICNIVDILNYGNIYSNECVAGIVSLVKLNTFDNNVIKLANTINYGQIQINPQYYATTTSNEVYQTYETITGLEHLEPSEGTYKKTHAGAICSIFDFSNRNSVEIRYLINLYSDAATVLHSLNTPSAANAPDISTFITSHGTTDKFGGNAGYIKYAPLTSIDDTINGNIGAFSENFVFYKAIKGEGLDTEHYITDLYISDFFEFVLFDKVNPYLLDKIGWRTIAYQKAAEELFKNVKALSALVDASDSEDLLSDAFTSDTWLSSMDAELLNSFITESMESGELNSRYKSIIDYILLDETATSTYTSTIRNQVVTKILEYYEAQGNNDYYTILQSMLYDVLLAKTISSDDTNYNEILTHVRTTLANSNLSTVFENYINLLSTSRVLLSPLFNETTGQYYENPKINLINTLLDGYDEYTLEELYNKLNIESSSEAIEYKLYLQNNTNVAKQIYIGMITYNSLKTNSDYLDWVNSVITKYDFNALLTSEKVTDATFSKMLDTFGNIADVRGYKYTPLTGVEDSGENIFSVEASTKTIQNFVAKQDATSLNVPVTKDYSALWNIIKNNSNVLSYIQNHYFNATYTNPTTGIQTTNGFLALATEYNNTYQSNDRSQLSYNIPISTKNGFGLASDANRTYYNNNSHGKNTAVNNRFIYTPDDVVSYRTNYFGPYMAATGTGAGQSYSADGKLTSNNLNYNIGMVLNVVDSSQEAVTKRYIVPVFMSINENITKKAISNSGTTTDNKNIYPFYWLNCNYNGENLKTDAHQDYMWKDLTFVSQIPTNATGFLYSLTDANGNLLNDKNNYIMDGYNFAPNYVPTIQSDYDSTRLFDASVHGMNKPDDSAVHHFTEHYLVGYATAAMVTGIWYTYSAYKEAGTYHISLHCKDENKNYAFDTYNYCGLHTTSYIGYTINDLVKLDGIKTKGKCNNELDEDEINIVSAICTKLLEDNKELVLRAVADYAKDNSFNSDNADALNMLISAVQDTNFATETVISDINTILPFKYTNTQTIEAYLESLNTTPTNYKDKIVAGCTNDSDKFKQLLLETLTNYAVKAKNYEDYYNYNRDAITNFVYKYVKYKHDNDGTDWDDFDSLFAASNDSDLTNINELFDLAPKYYYLDDFGYTDSETDVSITINDCMVYRTGYPTYNTTYDTTYEAVLVGETDFDGTNGSSIVFDTGDYEDGYILYVYHKNDIYLDDISNVKHATTTTKNSYELSSDETYTLYLDEDTEIYKIEIVNADSEAKLPATMATATAPFAVIDEYHNTSGGINFEYQAPGSPDKNTLAGYYYRMYLTNTVHESRSIMNINVSYTNVTINELKITFIISARQGYEALDIINKFNDQDITFTSTTLGTFVLREQSANRTYNIYKYEATIPLANISNNNVFSIDIHYKVPADYATSVMISNMSFDYDFDYNNGPNGNTTNVKFHQDLFSPYYDNSKNNNWSADAGIVAQFKKIYKSYMYLTNNNNCYVDIDAATLSTIATDSIVFPQTDYLYESYSFAYKINSAPVFTPSYYTDVPVYPEGTVLNCSILASDIRKEYTLVTNLELGHYDSLSDVGKYIIKDYFVKQSSDSFDTNSVNSYVEFYATGSGTIAIKDGDDVVTTINVSTDSGVYKWYEYITSDNYSYEASDGVTIDSVYVSPVGTTMSYTPSGTTDTLVANNNKTLVNFDYSTLATQFNAIKALSATKINDYSLTYDEVELFYTIYPYYRHVAGYTNEELYNNDIFETLITLMATIKQDSQNPTYYTIFAQPEYRNSNEKLIELIQLIALADYKGSTSALGKLINGLNSSYYDDLITYCCSIPEIRTNVVKKIYDIAKNINDNHDDGSNYTKLELLVYGAFLGDNYLDNSNYLESTYMYTLLANFNPNWTSNAGDHYGAGDFQFITSNSTVNSDIVSVVIEYLQGSSDIDLGGYGIYALASTQGKNEGKFIPDNLELDTHDSYYVVDGSVGYKLVSGSTSSSTWRGGIDDSSDPSKEDDVTDHSSVNYAFYKEMRQLKKSISTAVFELTLVDNATGKIEYYGDIDLDEKSVTFYLTEELTRTTYFKVSKIDLAYKAEAYDGPVSKYSEVGDEFDTSILISVTPADVTSHNASHQFTVFAEDTSVHKVYSIYFKVLKASFDLEYKDQTGDARYTKTVGSTTTNTTVELSLTSASANPSPSNYTDYLPIGLNLKPYIRLDKMDGTVVDTLYMDSDYIDLSTRSGDHIVKPVITNHVITGSKSTITMEISYKIPAGEYRITVSVCGYTAYVTYIKNANNQYTIEAHFGDSSANIFASSTTATSYVPFGRLYNNIELTDFDDDYDDETYGEFYLSYFSYSPNATVKCSATYLEVPVYDTLMVDGAATQVLLYNKYRYTITYVIEAEDIAINSGHKRTYTHIVEELDPYSNGSQFGTVTKDGEEVDPGSPTLYDQDAALDDDKVVSVKYQVGVLRTNNGDPVYKTEISKARVQFNRSDANGALNEPRYSISYNMDNIYTISPYATLTPVEITADTTVAGSATLKSRFGGMTIKMSYLTDTGVYEFKYVYNNKGVWYTLDGNNDLTYDNDVVVSEEYTSTYDFPAIQISKLFSLDATIHSITFMDAYQGASAASTGVRIHAMRPTDKALDTATGEMVYTDILDDEDEEYNDISVGADGDIVYDQKGTDYAATQYYDYYIVGAVSNAQLSNYAPTITIEDHALIFQYITAKIATSYGDGKQGNLTDAAVLEDHASTTYLYVPFTHTEEKNGQTVTVEDVFLVQLNGKTLTNVYNTKNFTTSSTAIGTLNMTLNDAKNKGTSFTSGGVTYTLNKAVFGEEANNYSLYMNYIGSPLDDHFWYVNYVVFSENFVRGNENIYLKYYHIAIIDRSNNVYFDVLVIVPVDFDITKYDTLYLLFQGTYKDATTSPATYAELAVGAYVYEPEDYTLNNVSKKAYKLRYNIQMLPSAYYYFNIDLPVGYKAEATVTNKTNFNAVNDYLGGNAGRMNYEGAYLPPSSIVAQVVQVTINVTPGDTGETNVWGITNSDVYTRRATLDNNSTVGD